MTSKQLLFRLLYRIGFTPWDEHPLAPKLLELVEGDEALPPGTALDLGCGTGDTSIYLAMHGWTVTAVDFVPTALDKARAKAATRQVSVNFLHANVTRLGSEGVGPNFGLIVDNGCLHGMSDDDRDAYVREVTAVAAPDARLLIVGFSPGTTRPVRGIDQAEVERRFTAEWTLLEAGDERDTSPNRFRARYYLFQRAS